MSSSKAHTTVDTDAEISRSDRKERSERASGRQTNSILTDYGSFTTAVSGRDYRVRLSTHAGPAGETDSGADAENESEPTYRAHQSPANFHHHRVLPLGFGGAASDNWPPDSHLLQVHFSRISASKFTFPCLRLQQDPWEEFGC